MLRNVIAVDLESTRTVKKTERKKEREEGRVCVCVCIVCSGVGCCPYAYVEQNSSSKVP